MSPSSRRSRESLVIVSASQATTDELRAHLPGVAIESLELEELARHAMATRPSVVVCDWPDTAASMTTTLAIRTARAAARIILVLPRSAERERLVALEAGVEEALPGPVSGTELAGRVDLLLRRPGPRRLTRLPIRDGVELDLDRRELHRHGEWVHLRPKEAGLLELLARAQGRVLTRRHILSRVWGRDHAGDPRTVDVHVRWLRSKVEPEPRRPMWIVTVRGVGYRLRPADVLTDH
jgi:DNA-binding response OmpR family regulator